MVVLCAFCFLFVFFLFCLFIFVHVCSFVCLIVSFCFTPGVAQGGPAKHQSADAAEPSVTFGVGQRFLVGRGQIRPEGLGRHQLGEKMWDPVATRWGV